MWHVYINELGKNLFWYRFEIKKLVYQNVSPDGAIYRKPIKFNKINDQYGTSWQFKNFRTTFFS